MGTNLPDLTPKQEVTLSFEQGPVPEGLAKQIEAMGEDPTAYTVLNTIPVQLHWGAGPNGPVCQLVLVLPPDLLAKAPGKVALTANPQREVQRFLVEDVLGKAGAALLPKVSLVVKKDALRQPDQPVDLLGELLGR